MLELKNVKRGRIRDYADRYKKAIFMPTDVKLEHSPLWNIKADCAFPSATQNESYELRRISSRTASR